MAHTTTGLYYTNITVGNPPITADLVIDLDYNSTTYAPVPCGSRGCPQPKESCFTTTCYGPFGPTCRNDSCISADFKSYLADTSSFNYILKDDVILSSSSSPYLAHKLAVRARFACVRYFDALRKLPYGVIGILGLASTSICHWVIGFYSYGGSYTIDVKSIEIYGKRVVTNNNKGPSLIGRPIPYSRLETSIYSALVKAFAEKAPKRDAVVPFADCFSYKTYGGKSMLEEETPVISLVLGGGAKWDIYGPNALVKVNKNVLCLAFEGENTILLIKEKSAKDSPVK
ncbi:hypothetical protein Bca52824_021188 [Brassica carinata]|uniref:Peptidase A1 domain-containing protein n=1 Tax=Brassica carinata TaxID=52824 RepID=A0A8X7VUW6_BRACI|nr:hypothetical protein Bca52824_021188 [Brassica carinata]